MCALPWKKILTYKTYIYLWYTACTTDNISVENSYTGRQLISGHACKIIVLFNNYTYNAYDAWLSVYMYVSACTRTNLLIRS